MTKDIFGSKPKRNMKQFFSKRKPRKLKLVKGWFTCIVIFILQDMGIEVKRRLIDFDLYVLIHD